MRKGPSLLVAFASVLAGGAVRIVQDQCGPFADVPPAFCPYVLEAFALGVAVGTSATTFSPDDPLTRGHGAVFVAKATNQMLTRSAPRAALGQFWISGPVFNLGLGVTEVGSHPVGIASDGADLWVANQDGQTVSRVRASDGSLLGTWTIVGAPQCVIVALGRVFVTSRNFGTLWSIDPTQPTGAATIVEAVGGGPAGLAYDGAARIWIANDFGVVHRVTLGPSHESHAVTGFVEPRGALYDGANIWITDYQAGNLLRLDAEGTILQTVLVGAGPSFPTFDGENIWVPNFLDDSVSVVRASTGAVLATLKAGPGPVSAAFDGRRVLVTSSKGSSISMWNAADLTELASPPVGKPSHFVCSDGRSFWLTLSDSNKIGRF